MKIIKTAQYIEGGGKLYEVESIRANVSGQPIYLKVKFRETVSLENVEATSPSGGWQQGRRLVAENNPHIVGIIPDDGGGGDFRDLLMEQMTRTELASLKQQLSDKAVEIETRNAEEQEEMRDR